VKTPIRPHAGPEFYDYIVPRSFHHHRKKSLIHNNYRYSSGFHKICGLFTVKGKKKQGVDDIFRENPIPEKVCLRREETAGIMTVVSPRRFRQ